MYRPEPVVRLTISDSGHYDDTLHKSCHTPGSLVEVNTDVDLFAFDMRICLLYAHCHGMSLLLLLVVIYRSGLHSPGRDIQTILLARIYHSLYLQSLVVPLEVSKAMFRWLFSRAPEAEADRRALKAPKKASRSVDALGAYLSREFDDEGARARAIFRWVTENVDYDTHGFISGSYGDLSASSVLSRRKAVCQGYAELFHHLASTAGLTAVTISGHGKGYGYEVGSRLVGEPNHAWNTVRIRGRWHLLDCTWGAGHVDERTRFVRKFDDHYFLTPPSQFIFDHFPGDPRWQLLDPVVSKSEFEERVHVKSSFFRNKLELESHRKGTISARDEVVVTLRSPTGVALCAELRQSHKGDRPVPVVVERVGVRQDTDSRSRAGGLHPSRLCQGGEPMGAV